MLWTSFGLTFLRLWSLWSEIEFSKSKELVASEAYKFKIGGGNLFLVNLREESQARAEASFQEARLAFMNTLLGYLALVSSGE